MLLTESQISQLRAEYSRINTIDPSGRAYGMLIKYLDSLDQANLKLLADGKIKFISALARNRVNRKG